MEKSQDINELFLALSRAQAEFPAIPLNAVNKFFNSRYADLGSVIEAAKEVLSNHQLAVTQLVNSADGKVGVTTILAHSSGQWISDTISIPLAETKGQSLAQVAGSSITYLRRYAYAAILGLYTGDDDDGESGKKEEKKPPNKPEQKKPALTVQKPPEEKKGEMPDVSGAKKVSVPTPETPPVDESTMEWFDKTVKQADELIDIKTINAIVEKFVGKDKIFTAPAHLKNHLRKWFHVDTLQEITWSKAKALINHCKGEGDDPKWYPPEEKKPEVHDPESSSGYTTEYLDSIVKLWELQDARIKGILTYEALPNEMKESMMTLLVQCVGEGKSIPDPNDKATIAGTLSA